jgi:putative transposase
MVTVCTKNRAPILANADVHSLLRSVWLENTMYRLGKYMIMPDHIHFFCGPGTNPPESLSRWMGFWKSGAARRWPGSGKVWQRDFWDTELRAHESYRAKWDYVRRNPVVAGLVEDPDEWPYQGEIFRLMWNE